MANLQNLSIKDLQRLVADLAKNPKSEEYSYKLIITNERDKVSQAQSDTKDVKSIPFNVKDATRAPEASSFSNITDKELTDKFPPDVAGLVGAYTTIIQSSADIRRLLLLDPSGRSARQALKDQTGKDLKVEAVLNIFDTKYDTREEQYERYRDLVDLGFYYQAVKMFAEKKYGFLSYEERGKYGSDYLLSLIERVALVTDNLFDMAIDHEDFKLAKDITKIIAIKPTDYGGHAIYDQGRNIGGRGILWWITNGNKRQLKFILTMIWSYFITTPLNLELLESAFNKADEMGHKDIAILLLNRLLDYGVTSKAIIVGTVKYDYPGNFAENVNGAVTNGHALAFSEAMAYIKSDDKLRRKAKQMLIDYTNENPDEVEFTEADINQWL